jgi:radical SAM protein with 4Fe4S-binding SPASM domain
LVRRLSSIILEITQQCNLRCKHCYIDAGVKKENELTLEEIKKLIDILTHMGVLNIMLSGGEPLLHPHLRDIIEYVRSKPLSVMVFTNGTLITEEIIQYFKEVGIAFVATSIDGATPETSDAFRGVKGSYEKTVRAIEMLKEVKIPVRVNVCLHKGILGEFEDLLALFKKWEITDYSIWPISYTGRSEREDFMVTPNEYKEVITQLKKYEFTEGVTNEFPYNPHLINCGIGRSSLTIRSDGTIVPCSPFPDSMSLGNAREDSIADIWNNSEFLRRVRHIDASISDMCKGCPHLNVCEGGCMAGNYRRTDLLECGDPFECAYFEVYDDYIPVEVTKQSRLSVEIR